MLLKVQGIQSQGCWEDLNDLDDGEFYYHEIIGLEVYEGDNLIGTIKEILQPGANDVWVVKRKGKRDLLLPYIPPVVLNVDIPRALFHWAFPTIECSSGENISGKRVKISIFIV